MYRTSDNKGEEKLIAKFNLVDLAGSERIQETEKNLERIEEAKFINKSLSALTNVVAALRTQAKQQAAPLAGRQSFRMLNRDEIFGKTPTTSRRMTVCGERPTSVHIPYRDSKLTHILKDSLGSNSFTNLIITLSPSYLCLTETISTLLFTKNAKAVK
jgi:hypothetical protein